MQGHGKCVGLVWLLAAVSRTGILLGGQVAMWGLNPPATREAGEGTSLSVFGSWGWHGQATVSFSLEMEGMAC